MVVVEEKKMEEEVKQLDLSDVRKLAIKQACEKSFLNHSLLCIHGNIDPRPGTLTGTTFKKISAVSSKKRGEEGRIPLTFDDSSSFSQTAFEIMKSELGCEFQPVLPVDAERVCEVCTREIYVCSSNSLSARPSLLLSLTLFLPLPFRIN